MKDEGKKRREREAKSRNNDCRKRRIVEIVESVEIVENGQSYLMRRFSNVTNDCQKPFRLLSVIHLLTPFTSLSLSLSLSLSRRSHSYFFSLLYSFPSFTFRRVLHHPHSLSLSHHLLFISHSLSLFLSLFLSFFLFLYLYYFLSVFNFLFIGI